MSVPYEIQPAPGNILEAGDTEVWVELDFPSRAFVSKVVVTQQGGTDAFSVELYNSKRVRDALLPAGVAARHYKVGPTMAGVSGVLEYFSDSATGGHGFSFYSLDAPDATRIQGVGQRKLYVRIFLSGAAGADKTFCVSVGGEQQVGD